MLYVPPGSPFGCFVSSTKNFRTRAEELSTSGGQAWHLATSQPVAASERSGEAHDVAWLCLAAFGETNREHVGGHQNSVGIHVRQSVVRWIPVPKHTVDGRKPTRTIVQKPYDDSTPL